MAGRYIHTGSWKDGVWTEEDVWVEYSADEYRAVLREQIAERRERLRQTDEFILEELEALFSATTLAGLLSTIMTAGTRLKNVLTERMNLRREIAEMEDEDD